MIYDSEVMVIDNNNNYDKNKKNKSIIVEAAAARGRGGGGGGRRRFIQSEQVVKEFNALLKYYGAENVQPDLEKTQKILDKFDINKELVEICEI
jgi:hypothetical protein